jgi:hypothetical protein
MTKYTIKTGRFTYSALAVGDKAKARADQRSRVLIDNNVFEKLDELINLLKSLQTEQPEANTLRESAVQVKKELKKKRPDMSSVRNLLTQIVGLATGLDALTDAAIKAQALITRIFPG